MEITEPLTTLRELLEARLSCSLSEHEFYLQDSLALDPTKNLVEQCVQGEGMVQINVEVKSQPGNLLFIYFYINSGENIGKIVLWSCELVEYGFTDRGLKTGKGKNFV